MMQVTDFKCENRVRDESHSDDECYGLLLGIWEKEIKFLAKPDAVMVKKNRIRVQVDYPIRKPVLFDIHAQDPSIGFTRKELALNIGKMYNKVYANADKYGVWGHSMEDLILVDLEYNTVNDIYCLSVDS
jgi:hypothetical protein